MSTKNITIEKIVIKEIIDPDPDLSYIGHYSSVYEDGCIDREERGDWLDKRTYRYFYPATEYAEQDYKIAEGYNNGQFCFIGIQACATVKYDLGQGTHRLETLYSGGLWGIENTDDGYIEEVKQEELSALKAHLEMFNVDTADFDDKAEDNHREYI